jgi:hypothetical protein
MNPTWKWSAEEIFPSENGFTFKWKAEIPVKDETIVLYGLDVVEMEDDKIYRNEVYYDEIRKKY